jgi:hypothetical protein
MLCVLGFDSRAEVFDHSEPMSGGYFMLSEWKTHDMNRPNWSALSTADVSLV